MELSLKLFHILKHWFFASDKPLIAEELVELVNNALGFVKTVPQQVETAIEGIKENTMPSFTPLN